MILFLFLCVSYDIICIELFVSGKSVRMIELGIEKVREGKFKSQGKYQKQRRGEYENKGTILSFCLQNAKYAAALGTGVVVF